LVWLIINNLMLLLLLNYYLYNYNNNLIYNNTVDLIMIKGLNIIFVIATYYCITICKLLYTTQGYYTDILMFY
jgi:hypothetical protein